MSRSVPVSEVIESLQAQVEELKFIASEYQSTKDVDQQETKTTMSDLTIQKELEELKIKYAKSEYRIEMLCRALDEKDKVIKTLSTQQQ
ncbi:hypothetical protein INT43_000837 [Umbelopsis isabellina]|uniref:Uncharacterized protein n=1 Tax=Mortierella isabellina TaxID=91625 RepID=A0A8H7Q4J9_MORIS|nr:hypothetical protein INT43_000837 [Umbelopsis isabellina]